MIAMPDFTRTSRRLTSQAPALLHVLLCICLLSLSAQNVSAFDTSKDSYGMLLGYGQSIPGWGQTTERIETIDLVPRYTHVTFEDIGTNWWIGKYSTLVELPVHAITSPDSSAMIGLNFLACFTFTASKVWQPYIFGGGGPVYSFADIEGMGASWNGNYQFALGLDHALSPAHSLLFEVRYHHISNAGIEDPNIPLNSIKFLVGWTF